MPSKRRGLPEINAGSMADIAFLLLIFFLVTTTMDQDTGISRKLPPIPEEEQEKPPEIKAKNIYVVLINSKNQLLVEGEWTEISQLKDRIRELEDATNVNPWQKVIHLARAVDSWRIFPRIFVVVYIYLMYESVIWFMNLPEPNLEQSALVSVVVGAMGVVFGVYSGKSGQSKGFKGEDDN